MNQTDKTHLWQQAVAFAQNELQSDTHEKTHPFSRELWAKCGSFGIQGLPVPILYGGKGYTASETALTLEALGYGCADNSLLAALSAHLLSCVLPLWKFGTSEQKARYLPFLCDGTWIGAHGATETEAGSDIFGLQTQAQRAENSYVITGQKTYILNAPMADLFIIFARLPAKHGGITAFLVEKEAAGITVTRTIHLMGLQRTLMGEITLTNCSIPAHHLLGSEGGGTLLFQLSMGWERSLILAPHLGTMRRVLEKCILRARQRQQFGQNIGKFQSISNMIADMKVRIEASRLLLYQAAQHLDGGNPDLLAAATAKLFLSEAAVSTYLDAIRIHGASGYTYENEFASDLQDAIGTLILSGTSDMQRQIIVRLLGV